MSLFSKINEFGPRVVARLTLAFWLSLRSVFPYYERSSCERPSRTSPVVPIWFSRCAVLSVGAADESVSACSYAAMFDEFCAGVRRRREADKDQVHSREGKQEKEG